MWDIAKVAMRGNCAHYKRQISQIIYVRVHLSSIEKEQNNPRACGRGQVIKIKAGISEIEEEKNEIFNKAKS